MFSLFEKLSGADHEDFWHVFRIQETNPARPRYSAVLSDVFSIRETRLARSLLSQPVIDLHLSPLSFRQPAINLHLSLVNVSQKLVSLHLPVEPADAVRESARQSSRATCFLCSRNFTEYILAQQSAPRISHCYGN